MDKKASKTLSLSVLVIVLLLSACSSPTPAATNPPTQAASTASPTVAPSSTATANSTATPAVTGTPLSTAIPTALDPCQLITSQEASTLATATFGAGLEGTTPGGGKTCTYGAQTINVFFVEVVQAADLATAQAAKAQFLADIQAKMPQITAEGIQPTQIPSFADGAITAQVSINTGGETVNGSAFGFLKGTIFFGFSDVAVGGAAPSSAAMQAEATTVLGMLP